MQASIPIVCVAVMMMIAETGRSGRARVLPRGPTAGGGHVPERGFPHLGSLVTSGEVTRAWLHGRVLENGGGGEDGVNFIGTAPSFLGFFYFCESIFFSSPHRRMPHQSNLVRGSLRSPGSAREFFLGGRAGRERG